MKKYLLSILLLCSWQLLASENTSAQYKDSAAVLKIIKTTPKQAINGPFMLNIKSVTKSGLNTHLNTQENPNNPENIVVEMPPFILAHHIRNTQTDPSSLFLNQNLIIKGQIKSVQNKSAKNSEVNQSTPTLKLIFVDQLAYYD